MRRIFVTFFLALGLCYFPAAAQERHEVGPGRTNSGAVTLAAFNKRIEDSAADYLKQYPPGAISRIVLFDSAFPIDDMEYKASGGYGVLLISAFSRDQSELPLANVYVDNVRLKNIGGISRRVPPDSLAYAAFGLFRIDSLWLVPANLFRDDVGLTADFAKNRSGFSVGKGLPPPNFMKANSAPQSGQPNFSVLKKLVAREYPGFGIEISP